MENEDVETDRFGFSRCVPIRPHGLETLNAADYKHSGCAKAAKLEFPSDAAARKDFKHWCKDQWKMYKASHP